MSFLRWIKKKGSWISVLLVFGLGAFLRLYDLGTESYWFDEVMSIYFAQRDLNSIANLPIWEVQIPPLYYFLLHFWIGFFGASEFAVRFLSAIFGMLSVLVLYKLGKTMFNFEVGSYGALILAVSLFHVKYSQEARMYGLLTFATLLSIFFFVKILRENQLEFWVGYVAGSALMVYSHFYGLFIVLFQSLFFLLYWNRNKKILKRYILSQIAVFLVFLPWLLKLLGALSYILGGQSSIAWLPRPPPVFLLWTFFVFSNGSVVSLILFGVLSNAGITNVSGRKLQKLNSFFKSLKRPSPRFFTQSSPETIFCILWLWFSIIVSFSLSWIVQPIYHPKYLIIASPAFYLLAAKGLTSMRKKARNILILVILLDSASIMVHHYVTIENEQWREVAKYIEENAKPNEIILINAPWMELPFSYYFKGANMVKGLNTVELLNQTVTGQQHPNIWLVLSSVEYADPEGLVKKELDETYVSALEREYVSLDVLYSVSFFGYSLFNIYHSKIAIHYYVNFSAEGH